MTSPLSQITAELADREAIRDCPGGRWPDDDSYPFFGVS